MTEELLFDRMNQLKEIDERLERIAVELCRVHNLAPEKLEQLRFDLRGWIVDAEAAYHGF